MKLKVEKYVYEEKNFWEVFPPKKLAKPMLAFVMVFLVCAAIPQVDNLITPFEDRVPANYKEQSD